jgi:hypothetical protein
MEDDSDQCAAQVLASHPGANETIGTGSSSPNCIRHLPFAHSI